MITVTSSPTAEKLKTFGRLPVGWHYGSGGPIPADRIRQAEKLLEYMTMLGFTRTDAFPGADHEILLSAYHQGHYLGLVLEPDNTYSLTHELDRIECCSAENKNLGETKALLRKVAGEIWPIFVWSTQPNMTGFAGNLMISHSKNLLTVACQSSSEIARKPPVAA